MQKIAEVALAYEAYARAVLLFGVGQLQLLRYFPHAAFGHVGKGKQHVGKLALGKLIEKVGLILFFVLGFKQIVNALFVAYSAIVPSGDIVGAQSLCILQKGAELYLPVAQHVGVGGTPLFVFFQKVAKHPVHILLGKVYRIVGNAQLFRYAPDVLVVLLRRAAAVLLLLPVVHKQRRDVVSLLFEQPCGNGAVHAAAHAHYYPFHVSSCAAAATNA